MTAMRMSFLLLLSLCLYASAAAAPAFPEAGRLGRWQWQRPPQLGLPFAEEQDRGSSLRWRPGGVIPTSDTEDNEPPGLNCSLVLACIPAPCGEAGRRGARGWVGGGEGKREKEREKEGEKEREKKRKCTKGVSSVCVFVCVLCVYFMCVCALCVCVVCLVSCVCA